jgi:SAM-dependent methyltransferase
MSTQAWFEDWFDTPYYHQLYFQRNATEAAAFINTLVNHLQPAPQSKMLDVACGRGRHSLLLAEKGFEVTGIDLSNAAIEEAAKMERENLHFYRHDMRQPFWINYFDYAFNFFTSFGYFHTRREHDAAIRTMAQALRPDGLLVIDFLNVHYAEDRLQPVTEMASNGYRFHITRWMDKVHFFKKIAVESNELTMPLVYTEQVSKFSLGDFTAMLARQGLQVTEVFGDYNLGPYHVRNSPRMIIIAKKIRG